MEVISGIISTSIRMAIPLGYAAIAGSVSELAGVVALGLEGFMTIGAFAGVAGAYFTGNAWAGVLSAMLAGALFALVFGVFCIKYESNQVVAGVGMNIIAEGLVSVLMIGVFGNKGKSEMVNALGSIQIPLIEKIPFVKTILSGYSGLMYILIIITILLWIVIYRTPVGIRLRATGINSEVVESLGIRSNLIKYVAVIFSGVMAGMGGAFLSLSQLNFYSKGMVSGRGYIALAIFVFARKNPVYCFLVSLLFGFTEAIQLRLQTFPIPSQFLSMLPYLCTLIIMFAKIKGYKDKNLKE